MAWEEPHTVVQAYIVIEFKIITNLEKVFYLCTIT